MHPQFRAINHGRGLLSALGRGKLKVYFAGSHPGSVVNPVALKTLIAVHVTADGCRTRGWLEFAGAGAPALDFVFTVCDNVAGEVCPVWPGQPMTAHWGVADPTLFEGTDEQKAKVFFDTAMILKRRIELMLALPLASLDRLAIQREIREIGAC